MLTRRRFAQLLGLSIVAMSVNPAIAGTETLPLLVGDGIHNDAPALNVLFGGNPVEIGPMVNVRGAGWVGNSFVFPGGKFRLEQPVVLNGLKNGVAKGSIYGTELIVANPRAGFVIDGCAVGGAVMNFHFINANNGSWQ